MLAGAPVATAQRAKREFTSASRSVAVAFAVACVTAGCTKFENVMASIPVFSFLREAPSFDPYEAPRPAPAGAVPYLSPAGNVGGPIVNSDAGLTAFGATALSPYSTADGAALAAGKVMFDRHCMVCHGVAGKGDGPVLNKAGETGKFPFAPNLMLPITFARSDGYLYGIIAAGRGLMPPYGPRMSHNERWATVMYLRSLHAQAGIAPAAPAAPQPAPGQGR